METSSDPDAPREWASDDIARLTVLGAAGEVTGSCLLVETARSRVLVECGLIQGGRHAEARNRAPFPFDPRTLDAALITHAHIDHSGRLPRLVRDGYPGPVHATTGSADLLEILLPDSAHLHEQDARISNRRRRRQGCAEVEPLYTTADAQDALCRLRGHGLVSWFEVADGVRARFHRAGHILGSATLELEVEDAGTRRRLVISGDLGREQDPLLRPAAPPEQADLLLMECTYGDREHRTLEATLDEFAGVLDQATREGANVIVPVFAVGRAQEVLHHLAVFEREGRVAPRPVYLDSPMAISVTELYGRHRDSLRPELIEALDRGESLAPTQLRFCRTPEQSMALNDQRGVVILAGSGMCTGGRVVHHLRHHLWRPETHVVIAGFQAQGTTGRALVDGASHVRILGERVAVRARVHTIGGFSAHADQRELLAWARPLVQRGARVALWHGEAARREAFAAALREDLGVTADLPSEGQTLTLRRRGAARSYERLRG